MRILLVNVIILLVLPVVTLAARKAQGLGGVAQNIMQPVSLMSSFIATGCFIIGGSFLFASMIKYIEHRRSPLMIPISTVVFLFLAGLVLILLPLVGRLTEGGVLIR